MGELQRVVPGSGRGRSDEDRTLRTHKVQLYESVFTEQRQEHTKIQQYKYKHNESNDQVSTISKYQCICLLM